MDKTFKIRARFLVDKEYQYRFIRAVLFQTLVALLILVSAFYIFQREQMDMLTRLSMDESKLLAMQEWTWGVFLRILGIVALVCGFQCLLVLIFSHRSAGPMYRLKNYLTEITKGALPRPIQFRRGDHFRDVQDAYNEMVTVLEKERINDLRIIQQMEEGLIHLKRLAKDEQVHQMVEYIERLNNDLKNFKTR